MLHFCYTFPSGLLPAVTAGQKKEPLLMGRLSSVELFTSYYFLSDFRSPDLPNREAMRSITFSFVNTNFRARNAHFNTVFMVESVLNCSTAKVRSAGVVAGSASGWRQMTAVMYGYRRRMAGVSSEDAGRLRRRAGRIPGRH